MGACWRAETPSTWRVTEQQGTDGSLVLRSLGRRQEAPYEVPVPCLSALSGARILQRLVLEAVGRKTNGTSVSQKALPVHGDQVRHPGALPDMAMQPEPSVHRELHPRPARCEFTVWNGAYPSRCFVRQSNLRERLLLTEWRALLGRRAGGSHISVEHAAHAGVGAVVRRDRLPTSGRGSEREIHAACRVEADQCKVVRILPIRLEVHFLGDREVAQVALQY